MRLSRVLAFVGLMLGTIGCDQGTKRIAEATLMDGEVVSLLHGTVRFFYAENPGAWGSLGAGWPPVVKTLALVVIPVLVLVGLVVHAFREYDGRLKTLVGPALIAGGGFGNLIDRVVDGYVVDFMWMGVGRLTTNVFNVADVALLAGIALMWAWRRKSPDPKTHEATRET